MALSICGYLRHLASGKQTQVMISPLMLKRVLVLGMLARMQRDAELPLNSPDLYLERTLVASEGMLFFFCESLSLRCLH